MWCNRAALVTSAALVAVACMSSDRVLDPPGPPDPPRASRLVFLKSPIHGIERTVLSRVEVALLDSAGNVVAATDTVTIGFDADTTGGRLMGTLRVAAVDGVARFNDLRIDRPGKYRFSAAARDLPATRSLWVDVGANGIQLSLRFEKQPAASGTGDRMEAITVELLDSSGQRSTTASQDVMISIGADPGHGVLQGRLAVTPRNGVATFDSLHIRGAGNGYTLVARAPGHFDAVSEPFDVAPLAAAQLSFVAQPGDASAGDPLAPAVRVAAIDVTGHLAAERADTITIELSGPGILGGTRVAVTDSGIATFANLTISELGSSYRLRARSGRIETVSNPFAVLAPLPMRGAGVLAASYHSCALAPGGAAWCWGPNHHGQLGNGRIIHSAAPVLIPGGHSFVSLTTTWIDDGDAGSPSQTAQICGLERTGAIICWGKTFWAGGGAATMPTRVAQARSWKALTSGYRYVCALDTAGLAWCWGHEDSSPTMTDSRTPVQVAGGQVFASIDGGSSHACALEADGSAWCWGRGILGDSTRNPSPSPRRVSGGHAFTALSVGHEHSCGLRSDGQALCWGGDQLVPTAVPGGHTFTSISAGHAATCGITRSGDVVCWGHGFSAQPAVQPTMAGATVIEAGNNRGICGISGSRAWCLSDSGVVRVPGSVSFATVLPGADVTCGLSTAGEAWCWGSNDEGALADGPLVIENPVPVGGGQTFAAIHTSGLATCALTATGAAWCWGWNHGPPRTWGNREGHAGASTPIRMNAPASFAALSSGSGGICALTATGEAYCWNDHQGPQPVHAGYRFAEVSNGDSHACGITRGGLTLCWGHNGAGQLGSSAVRSSHSPLPAAAALRFRTISAGAAHTCALTTDGTAWCWGWNIFGQLGAVTTEETSPYALHVQGNHTFTALASGYRHTCALETGGEAWCWGQNTGGELGNGSTASSTVPVPVSGGHLFTDIVVGFSHTCASKADGAVWCWGSNTDGALGTGSRTNSPVPVQVSGISIMRPNR